LFSSGAAHDLRVAEPGLMASVGLQIEALPDVHHVLTHFDWLLHPRRLLLPAALAAHPHPLGRPGRWVARHELTEVALPAPLRKLLLTAP
jgi:A/G-specific adenine glycosylase